VQILIAINMSAFAMKELYLQDWDFSQETVVTVINSFLYDLTWFSVNLLTLYVNRDTFEAFAWKFKT